MQVSRRILPRAIRVSSTATIALGVGLAALCASTRASADTSSSDAPTFSVDERRARAEALFVEGLHRADTNRDWEGALAAFMDSRRIFPTRSATRNAAIALRQLGRFAEAYELYGDLLHEFATVLTAEQVTSAEAERKALLAYVGKLDIRIQEQGVSVMVDGKPCGVTPLAEPLNLDVGTHMLRFSKQGFETLETQTAVVAGTLRSVDGMLRPLTTVGNLTVSEIGGERLDVIVDGSFVGRTPWRGALAVGHHSVILSGQRRGTAPVAVELKPQDDAKLELTAIALDAEVEIRPVPVSATLYADGVFLGSGAWSGALPSGLHRFEAVAPGYATYRIDVVLESNGRALLKPMLVVNADPGQSPPLGLHVEASMGLLFANSFRGSVDMACDCSTRSRPFGWLVLLRSGYALTPEVGAELSVGYLSMSESSVRHMTANSTEGKASFVSENYRDAVELRGPLVGLGVKFAPHRRLPLTARLTTGLSWLRASPENTGTFSNADEPPLQGELSVPEPTQTLLTPWVSTELRYGYRWGRYFELHAGLALQAFFPPANSRSDRWNVVELDSEGERKEAGVLVLPDEPFAQPFLALSPSVAARVLF